MTGRWTFATLAAILATFAADAHAIPFGANLNAPANVPFDCTALPVNNALGTGYVVLPSRAATCTWMPTGSIAQPSAGQLLTPTSGTVTAIQIRVGPITGPMQVIVMEAFRKTTQAESVCCQEVARTPPFTPPPNAVSTIQTALPVRKDIFPNPVNDALTFDTLALSVLAPNVPIPAFDTGLHDATLLNAPLSAVYYPAVAPGQEAFIPTGVGGFQILLAADVTPGPVAGATVLRLLGATAAVSNNAAPLLIRCELGAGRCGGVILLQNGRAAGARAASAHAAKTTTYGSAHYDIGAGKSSHVKIKLSSAGRALLRRHRSAKVYVNATMSGKKIAGVRLTLKR